MNHVSDLGTDGKLVKGHNDVIPGAIPESNGRPDLSARLNFAETQSRKGPLTLHELLELCEIRHRAQQANNITEQAAYPD